MPVQLENNTPEAAPLYRSADGFHETWHFTTEHLDKLAEMVADANRLLFADKRFRRELSERAVALYPDGEVIRVVLTELIVQ